VVVVVGLVGGGGADKGGGGGKEEAMVPFFSTLFPLLGLAQKQQQQLKCRLPWQLPAHRGNSIQHGGCCCV